MSNVVSLDGGVVHAEREPQESVIEELERLLTMARAGEIQGLAAAVVHADNMSSYSIRGPVVGAYGLLGAVTIMSHKLAEAH